METDSLLQQSFDHLKEQLFFCFEGWVFLALLGLGNLFAVEGCNGSVPTFAHFWGSIFGPWKEKMTKSVPKIGPKTGPQNLTKSLNIFRTCCLLLANLGPTKIRKTHPSKQKNHCSLKWSKDCWSKQSVSIQLKNCSAMRKSYEHTKFLPQNAI